MKLRILITLILISSFQLSQAQEKEKNVSLENNQEIKQTKTTEVNQDQAILSEKEWEKILKKIRKTKKRISKKNNIRYVSKIVDTVYIEMPSPKSDTRLSDW